MGADVCAGGGTPMKVLWTLVKVVVGLAVLVPLGIIALALALGAFATLLAFAVMALKLAVVGVIVLVLFRLLAGMFGWSRQTAPVPEVRALPPVDPYYEAAKRELDRDLGESRS
jgi:hypothetical protein